MATLSDLIRNTEKYKPLLFINADRIRIERINITRSQGTRSILFSTVTKDTEHNHGRKTQMMFIVPPGVDVKDYKPSIEDDRVLVRTASPFFKFAYGYNLKRDGALFGKVSQFTVKGTGKPINPKNISGLDKHLISLGRYLRDSNLIRN